jgi:hypothetical protein
MVDSTRLALIHADIDGELEDRQRAELARCLLADPEARALHEELGRLCSALDATPQVEPPSQLAANVLAALPHSNTPMALSRPSWAQPRWRYAALIAGVVAAAAVLFETVKAPEPATTDGAGTMAAPGIPAIVDTVRLERGPVSGRVSLYRDRAGLGLALDLVAEAPVDVLIASSGRTLRIRGLRRAVAAGPPTLVPLPGVAMAGQMVNVIFQVGGREVGRATLRAPKAP